MAEQQSDEVLVEVDGRTLKISNLGKVMYPTTGTTKGEVLNYYARVAPVLLPHLADRAVTRIRWPHGTADMQFFEKNLPSGAPSWLHSVAVPSTGSRGGGDTSGRGRCRRGGDASPLPGIPSPIPNSRATPRVKASDRPGTDSQSSLGGKPRSFRSLV